MDRTHVMVVENDPFTMKSILAHLQTKNDIEVTGAVSNGKEAIVMLPTINVDILITDLVMPIVDGFGLLEHLQCIEYPVPPKVIVLTSLTRDAIISKAMSLGASYFMCKPCDLEVLYKRILEVSSYARPQVLGKKENLPPRGSDSINEMLDSQGISCSIRGYNYLHWAIQYGIEHGDLSGKITKEVYPSIARLYGTSEDKVERAIRHAIQSSWDDRNGNQLISDPLRRPSNGQFISMMVNRVASKFS